MEDKDPGKYIPIIYLLYFWGSLFGVPGKVPLYKVQGNFVVLNPLRVKYPPKSLKADKGLRGLGI